jgi:hypothetical protein
LHKRRTRCVAHEKKKSGAAHCFAKRSRPGRNQRNLASGFGESACWALCFVGRGRFGEQLPSPMEEGPPLIRTCSGPGAKTQRLLASGRRPSSVLIYHFPHFSPSQPWGTRPPACAPRRQSSSNFSKQQIRSRPSHTPPAKCSKTSRRCIQQHQPNSTFSARARVRNSDETAAEMSQ